MTTPNQVAEAVTQQLNAAPFSLPFIAAQRKYLPKFNLPEFADLQVTVVPKGLTTTGVSRGSCQHDFTVDVAVQRRVASEEPVEIDPLMEFVQELPERFQFRRLDFLPQAVWVKTEHQPIYSLEHLDELRLFTSVLTFTFRAFRAVAG